MTLALVRHGRTTWNLERRMQGRSDIALDDVGRSQADAAGRVLSAAVWTRVVTSPLRRAAESADIIRTHLPGAGCDVEPDLVERDYGAAEGLAVSDVRQRWPDEDYPAAESLARTQERGIRVVRALHDAGGSTIVVAHGTLLRLTIEGLTGHRCPRILNGEVVLLEQVGDRFRARRLVE